MIQAPTRPRLTVDDLDRTQDDDLLRQLVDGELSEWTPPGPEHGGVALTLGSA